MPLDPDDLRTPPPASTPAVEPAEVETSGVDAAPTPTRLPTRLIDRIDDAHAASTDTAGAASGEGPAPHPMLAPIGEPVNLGLLEPDAGTREAWMDEVARYTLDFVRGHHTRPAGGVIGRAGRAMATTASVPIPERPLEGGLRAALDKITIALEASLETAGPGYMAYVPGGGLYATVLAEMIAAAGNRYTGFSMSSPGCVRLEQDVLSWLSQEFGHGPRGRGLLTSGGSMANFSALLTARHHHLGDGGDYSRAIVYTSTQVHHSVSKGVAMLGIPRANLRSIAVDGLFRLDVDDLRRKLAADRHRGLQPFCVIASAGTTNTGAVDPLDALATVCADEDLWLHVDGAYGGCFQLCEPGRARLRGIERADSVCFDPHKGMFLPYGTGCLLVREGARLAAAHAGDADYLRDFERDAVPSPANLGPELSRPYRGLGIWLPLMLHGAGAFRAALVEKLALAELAAAGLDARIAAGAPLEVVARPQLSTVAFRLSRRDGEGLDDYNARNVALLERINARDRVYLSSTLLPVPGGAAVTLRVCVLSHRSHRAQIEALLEDLDAALAC